MTIFYVNINNLGPSAGFNNQFRPIGLSLYSLASRTQNHRNHKLKSHLHDHFGLKKKKLLNLILPRELKGVPGNGTDPLRKYLALPLFIFLTLIIILLGTTMIKLCDD